MGAGQQETINGEPRAQEETLVWLLGCYAHDGRHVLPEDFSLTIAKGQLHGFTIPGYRFPLVCLDGRCLPIGNDEVAVVADEVTGRHAQVVAELEKNLQRKFHIQFDVVEKH